MNIAATLWEELKNEAAVTRKYLERVPLDKADFKPHEKSMTLGRLSTHIAEIPSWWQQCLVQDELDFASSDYKPKSFSTNADLLAFFDANLQNAAQILATTNDAEFEKLWSMRNGETIYFTMPKKEVVRTWCLNHLYHHRAQLGVYLRMLDIAVPATYGPSADEG